VNSEPVNFYLSLTVSQDLPCYAQLMRLVDRLRMIGARIGRFAASTDGATAIEYGLIAAGIALAISAAVFGFGDAVYELLYSDLPGALKQ